MKCTIGNVSDQVCHILVHFLFLFYCQRQVLLHILVPVAALLPWWFYLFPAWIGVIFILVLSNVLSYVFNQRIRLGFSLPSTPAQVGNIFVYL